MKEEILKELIVLARAPILDLELDLTLEEYCEKTKVSKTTGGRDLKTLVEEGILSTEMKRDPRIKRAVRTWRYVNEPTS